MRLFLILVLLPLAAQASEISLLGRYPGAPKNARVSEQTGKLVLESNHSQLISRIKGVGRFVSSKLIDQSERKLILEEKRKLSVRKSFIEDLPADNSHGFFIKLDSESYVSLEEPFGKDLGALFDKLLERNWSPDEAVTFNAGKIQYWSGGKLTRSVLPSQASECRWESAHWSCEFKFGKIVEKDLK